MSPRHSISDQSPQGRPVCRCCRGVKQIIVTMRCGTADKLGKFLASSGPVDFDSWRHPKTDNRFSKIWGYAAFAALLFGVTHQFAFAAEIAEGQKLFNTGLYSECAAMAARQIAAGGWDENWHRLKASAELAQGKYPQAEKSLEDALELYPFSLPLRLLARTAYRYNGKPGRADEMLEEVERYVSGAPRRYGAPADRVALGRFLLEKGADPRQVLELVYDPLRKESPDFVDVYLATAELALDKYDNALAAETLRAAPKSAQDDPQYHFLLARAYASDEPEHAEKELAAALKLNPRHVDSLLFQVDHLIDAEEYDKAAKVLDDIFE